MAAPSYDDSAWPLFRVHLSPKPMNTAEFEHYLGSIDDLFLRGDRFAVVIDARDAPPHTPAERQEIARRMRASYGRYPHRLAAMGIVLTSALQRGIFTAITWIAGQTHPVRAFQTPEEAEVWAWERLRER